MAPTSKSSSSSEPLVCPRCATRASLDERFCPNCSMPLTYAGPDPAPDDVTERQRLARKIKPQLAEGELVKVAGARNQVEAEFVQSLLLEEGVPSTLRRARGFDVPDFLAAGPRDVLVPASGADVARQVLLQSDLAPVVPESSGLADEPLRLLVGVLAAFAVVALIVWLGSELLG